MRYRTTWILFALCVVATFLAIRVGRHEREWFKRDIDQPFNFPLTSLGRLEIQNRDTVLACEQGELRWRVVVPFDFPASMTNLERLSLVLRELRDRGAAGPDRPEYGLAQPAVVVRFMVGPTKHEIAFGDPHPGLPYVYARVKSGSEPERIILVSTDVREVFRDVTLEYLRDDAILDINSYRATRVVLSKEPGPAAAAPLVLVRQQDSWVVESPFGSDADLGEVRHLIDTLNSWAIEEFVADGNDPFAAPPESEAARYGLASPRSEITVEERDTGRSRTIVIGAAGPPDENGEARVYLAWRGRPHVFLASAKILPLLDRHPDLFRSRYLFRLPEPEVHRLELVVPPDEQSDGCQLSIEGTELGFRMQTAQGMTYPVDAGWFGGFTEALRGGRVAQFHSMSADDRANLQKFGFDLPWKIRITPVIGEPDEILVGKRVPGGSGERYVINRRWQQHYATALIPGEALLRGAPWTLRSSSVFVREPRSLIEFSLSDGQGNELTFARPSESWYIKGRPNESVPAPTLDPIIRFVTDLRAKHWERDPVSPPGPGDFMLRIVALSVDDDPEFRRRVFYVGKALPGWERSVRDGAAGWVFRVHTKVGNMDPFEYALRLLTDLAH